MKCFARAPSVLNSIRILPLMAFLFAFQRALCRTTATVLLSPKTLSISWLPPGHWIVGSFSFYAFLDKLFLHLFSPVSHTLKKYYSLCFVSMYVNRVYFVCGARASWLRVCSKRRYFGSLKRRVECMDVIHRKLILNICYQREWWRMWHAFIFVAGMSLRGLLFVASYDFHFLVVGRCSLPL